MRRWSGAFKACAVVLVSVAAHAGSDQRSEEVNKLFNRWNTSTTPGMNVLVLRDGKQIYSHSFGMANLELSKSNDSTLVYPVGSLTKQFTAYCIHLLAQGGKLALADDIRKYIPEMHDFGEVITLQMLLNHTSGLRDNVALLAIKGYRVDDDGEPQAEADAAVGLAADLRAEDPGGVHGAPASLSDDPFPL